MRRPGTDRDPPSRRWRRDALALTLALGGCSEPAAAPLDASTALAASPPDAPDAAGASLRFRGEDLRVVLS